MCCNTVFVLQRERIEGSCIAIQYLVLWLGGLQEENCVAIQNCIATERLGSWAGRSARFLGAQALGRRWACAERAGGRAWARRRGAQAGAGAHIRQGRRRADAQAGVARATGGRLVGAATGLAGRAAWALGAWPGLAGWP